MSEGPDPRDVADAFRQQRDIMANDAAYLRAAVAALTRDVERLRGELETALGKVAAAAPKEADDAGGA